MKIYHISNKNKKELRSPQRHLLLNNPNPIDYFLIKKKMTANLNYGMIPGSFAEN